MRVTVDQDCIDHGQRKHQFCCPIALAVAGLFPGYLVSVHHQMVFVYSDRGFLAPKIPRKFKATKRMMEFIKRFDRGDHVAPSVFHVKDIT